MNCPIFHLPKRKIDQIASPSPSHVHANPIPPANLSAHIEFPQINEFLMDKWYTIVCLIPKINFTQQNRKNDRKLSESFFSFWPPRTLFFGPTIATQSLSVIFFLGNLIMKNWWRDTRGKIPWKVEQNQIFLVQNFNRNELAVIDGGWVERDRPVGLL